MRYLPYLLLSCMAWGQAPNYISGEKGPTHIVRPVRIQADSDTSLVWDDPKGTLPLTCMPDATKTGWVCKVAPKPEPMDVPAIKHTPKLPKEDSKAPQFCTFIGNQRPSGMCINGRVFDPSPRWICADKTRILQHDEQNPPKYWCHRVEGSKD